MRTARDHDRFADDIGAYLLGALEPDERETFENHLSGCDECGAEVARLAVARDALPGSVEQFNPPEQLKASLMETVRADASARTASQRSRKPARSSRWRDLFGSRPRLAAAAAAAVVAVGVAAGALVGALGGSDPEASQTVAAVVDEQRMPAASASLVIPADADSKGGAVLRVEGMQRPQNDHVYEVWIKRGDKITPSSLFSVEKDGSGAAAIPDELHDADAVLVTREPEGGSEKPSESSLVTVQVPS